MVQYALDRLCNMVLAFEGTALTLFVSFIDIEGLKNEGTSMVVLTRRDCLSEKHRGNTPGVGTIRVPPSPPTVSRSRRANRDSMEWHDADKQSSTIEEGRNTLGIGIV